MERLTAANMDKLYRVYIAARGRTRFDATDRYDWINSRPSRPTTISTITKIRQVSVVKRVLVGSSIIVYSCLVPEPTWMCRGSTQSH